MRIRNGGPASPISLSVSCFATRVSNYSHGIAQDPKLIIFHQEINLPVGERNDEPIFPSL